MSNGNERSNPGIYMSAIETYFSENLSTLLQHFQVDPNRGEQVIERQLEILRNYPGPTYIFWDCDHALLEGKSMWELVSKKMPDEVRKESDRIRLGNLALEGSRKGLGVKAHVAWSKGELDRLAACGLTLQDIEEAVRPVSFRPGVEEMLTIFQAHDLPCDIVSSSIAQAIESVELFDGLIRNVHANRLIVNAEGVITTWDKEHMVNSGNKHKYVETVIKKAKIRPGWGKVIFGGDNRKDANMVTRKMVARGVISEQQIFRFCTPKPNETEDSWSERYFNPTPDNLPPCDVVLRGRHVRPITGIILQAAGKVMSSDS